MSDTPEDEEKAAFLRFLSIIYQVITDQISGCKFDFSQYATLKKLAMGAILMDNLTVLDITVPDATTG